MLKCDHGLCREKATWVAVAGCLEHMHVNVKYRCDKHAENIRELFAENHLVCWQCRMEHVVGPHHSDDLIMRSIWREVA